MGTGGSRYEFILETTLWYRYSQVENHTVHREEHLELSWLTLSEREQITHRDTASSSAVTDAQGQENHIFKVLRGNKCQHGILRYHLRQREAHKN